LLDSLLQEKMDADDYNLKWNNFETGITSGLMDILKSRELFDVTLVCGSKQIQAHRLVLSACSPVFRAIFNNSTQTNPIVYLRGISFHNLEATINFMYKGEVCVSQEKLSDFLSTAEDLKVKGLSQANKQDSLDKRDNSLYSENQDKRDNLSIKSQSKKRPSVPCTTPAEVNKRLKGDHVAVLDQPDESPMPNIPIVKKERSEETSLNLETAVLAQEDAEYIDYDYDETNYDVIQEYSGDPLSHAQSQIHFNSSNDYIGPVRGTGPKPKADRQPIVNFINLNKVKVDRGYMCTICERISADNSNMNRHIEIKHSDQLELFLASDQAHILVT